MVAIQKGFTEAHELAAEVRALLMEQYLADARPWVVAFSGGKDSTVVLQLVYDTLIELGDRATKPVHVISSDTQVEAPNVAEYVAEVLEAVAEDADRRRLPLRCHLVRPVVSETFWAKLIGKGYPPPTRWFRWCTTSMKIKPSRREIASIAAEHGSVLLLLGTRMAESWSRKKRMQGRVVNTRALNPHHEIPNAYVLTPIAEWEDDEVWDFLYTNNPPSWELPHAQLLTLYRNAQGGECPVVMDLNTPSCGGSRFGCWTCTVVKLDRSMEGFIDSGEEWMRPLAEYRNWLKEFREREDKRMRRRRDGSEGVGPFTSEARYEILEHLLQVERTVGKRLISDDELGYIQAVWSQEFDLRGSAADLAARYGRHLNGGTDVPLDCDDRALLEDIVAERGINPHLVSRILELEAAYPNLDKWGVRPELRRRLEELIAVSVAGGSEG